MTTHQPGQYPTLHNPTSDVELDWGPVFDADLAGASAAGDWETPEVVITQTQPWSWSATVATGGWQHPDQPAFAGVLIDGEMVTVETARRYVAALSAAVAEVERR